MKTFITLLVAICFTTVGMAQNHGEHNHKGEQEEHNHITTTEEKKEVDHSEHAHAVHGKHKISLYTGFTHIQDAFYEHEIGVKSTGKWVPTLGLDYWYTYNDKFDFGAMIDIELDEYYIEQEGEEKEPDTHSSNTNISNSHLQRNNVVVGALVAKYKPMKGLGIFVGPGIEWEFAEETKSFWVVKAGVEYEIEIDKGWEITPSFIYDFKEEYSACSFGFSIGKRF